VLFEWRSMRPGQRVDRVLDLRVLRA